MMRACTRPPATPQSIGLAAMRAEDLAPVLEIEQASYALPWTRGNFVDSLTGGCQALCLRDARSALLGYLVALRGANEVHLLNLTVAPGARRHGHARYLLEHLRATSVADGATQIWLEVRADNDPALTLYRSFGFTEVGLRRGYYPAARSSARADAVAMSLALQGS